jgi:hypothetical protein
MRPSPRWTQNERSHNPISGMQTTAEKKYTTGVAPIDDVAAIIVAEGVEAETVDDGLSGPGDAAERLGMKRTTLGFAHRGLFSES